MPLPSNPSNNQTAVVNGILYTYNSTKGAWTVSTNSEVTYTMAAVTATGLVTAGNIKTTSGIFWSNGAPLGGSAGGTTNQIQYNSSNSFAGATNFTYTAASGNVVIGATTATSSTTTGALVVAGGAGIAGNVTVGDAINFTGAAPEIVFTAANPWINATSYIHFPGGAYFNSGTVYTEAALRTRGGIINDTGTKILTIGSTSQLSVANTMSSTSTTTGALLVSGGVGVAGQGVFGGNLTVGNMNQTRANLLVFGGNLNAGVGSSIALAEFYATNTNGSYLRILNNRHTQGADWTSASTKIQQMIDVTPQGYIEFNPIGANYGVSIGQGGTEIMRLVSGGNVVINATTASTSTTTGVLVVKGGVGIAGQVTAGNVMTTSGVFWANGAAYSSGSGGGSVATSGIFLNGNSIPTSTTIPVGQNGFSVGPITTPAGVTVTVTAGQRWVII
jgi:hypothetical protein